MTRLRTFDLVKRFRGTTALDHVDLTVEDRSVYALIGENGAGKSTLLKILINLQRATVGRAEVRGKDTRRLSRHDIASIGYISEDQRIPRWMKVRQFMDYLRPFYPSWDSAYEADLLRQFNLPLDRKLGALSHGMRMKAALASVLAFRPNLLLLDEPFNGLDPLVRDDLAQALSAFRDATILMSSHELDEIEGFTTHVGFLTSGRLQFSEEKRSLDARFRDIEVLVDGPVVEPESWPASWLNPAITPGSVRFVDSQFEEDKTVAEIRSRFGNVRDIALKPMALRSVFVSIARARMREAL